MEPVKLKLIKVDGGEFQGKSVFVFHFVDKFKTEYECRMTSLPIYKESIQKQFSRLRAVDLPPDEPSKIIKPN